MKNIIKLSVLAIMMAFTTNAFAQQAAAPSATMAPGTVPPGIYYDAQVFMPKLEDAIIGDVASATIDVDGRPGADFTESQEVDKNNRILPAKFLVGGNWVMGCMLVPDYIAADNCGKGWVKVAATVRPVGKVVGSQRTLGIGTTAIYWMAM